MTTAAAVMDCVPSEKAACLILLRLLPALPLGTRTFESLEELGLFEGSVSLLGIKVGMEMENTCS